MSKYVLAAFTKSIIGNQVIREVVNGQNRNYTVDDFAKFLKGASPEFRFEHFKEVEKAARAISLLHTNFEKYYKPGVKEVIENILVKATNEWNLTKLVAEQLRTILMQSVYDNLDFIIKSSQPVAEPKVEVTNEPVPEVIEETKSEISEEPAQQPAEEEKPKPKKRGRKPKVTKENA